MDIRHRIFGWLTLTLLGLGTVGAIISSYFPKPLEGVNQPVATNTTFIVLYLAVFAFVLGLCALAGYSFRYSAQKTIFPTDHYPVIRQAVLIALGAVALLILQGLRVLSWWDAVLLIIALLLVELSFRAKMTV